MSLVEEGAKSAADPRADAAEKLEPRALSDKARRTGGTHEHRVRWILTDLIALVALSGVAAGVLVWAHAQGTTVASQSALVEAPLDGLSAPVSGTLVEAPPLPLKAVNRHTVLFRIRTASGRTVSVRSPVSGQLASMGARLGDVLSAGQMLGTITPNAKWTVVAMVPEGSIRRVKVGDRATLRLMEDPGTTFQGHVLRIWPQSAQTYLGSSLLTAAAAVFIKQTELLPVVVSLPYRPQGLAVGESAEVQIHVANG